MSELEHIRPDGLSNSPAYTQVVAARGERIVHVSGQVAVDADGRPVGVGDLGQQTEQVMDNLQTALAAAGAGFDDVVKITTYVVNYVPEHRAVIAGVRGRYLPADRPPASTLVGVTALAAPEYLIEIEAVAVLD
jgi:enamine deaminase RidA (YjgF/YER057c/UK114 family)